MKGYIIPLLIIAVVISGIIGVVFWLSSGDSVSKKLLELDIYSEEEISFLKEQGFLDDINKNNFPGDKESAISLLKSSGLTEQDIDNNDESFIVLAAKLDQISYQLAFRLENKSDQSKDFYLIPVSQKNQVQFQKIKGVINNRNILSINRDDIKQEPLETLYDIKQHKQELTPELAQAYDDIDNKDYQPEPIKITLSPKSILLAKSQWEINRGPSSVSLEPVYFLVYGSAGGAKDDLTILNVHSRPQQGENWEVEFITRGKGDLRIIPNDQATIDDDEFAGLFCNSEKRAPQILSGDIIYYPDWQCVGTAKLVHYTKKQGNHTLRFEFNNQTSFAYNSGGSWLTGWSYRKKITVQSAYIDSNLTDFPVYVKINNDSDIAAAQNDGDDIRFTDNDGETLLKYEEESWSGGGGSNVTADYWVKVPNLYASPTGDQNIIYIYYGKADASDAQDAINVWDGNYKAVWHMNEASWNGTAGEVNDSTTNGNDGVRTGDATTTASGKIGRGGTFDGTGDAVNCGTGSTLSITTNITLSAWANLTTGGSYREIISKHGGGSYGYDIIWFVSTGQIAWGLSTTGSDWNEGQTANSAVSASSWYHIVATYNGSYMRVYINGAEHTGGTLPKSQSGSINVAPAATYIGVSINNGYYFYGTLDEVRIANDPRADAEIKFEYRNVAEADNELSWGSEEIAPPTITSAVDYPDPLESGQTINFSADWDAVDTVGVKLLVCRTNSITAATPACDSGEWCSNKDDYEATNPISCNYTTQAGDLGNYNYYIFICDDNSACSSATSGTFTVQPTSISSLSFQGKAPGRAAGPWLSGWDYRKKITVQSAYIDSNLTDFPLYVKINNDSDLAAAQNDGDDIRFTDNDGETLLKYEEESWSGGGGSAATANYWVKAPNLYASPTGDQNIIYIYYGKADAADGQDAVNVWDSNFKAVWHLGEASWDGTPGEVNDSTTNGNNGVRVGDATTTVSGKIGRGGTFDGSGDWVNAPIIDFAYPISYSVWLKPALLNNNRLAALGRYYYNYYLGIASSSTYYQLNMRIGSDIIYRLYSGATTANWVNLALTYDGGHINYYVNGVLQNSDEKTGDLEKTNYKWQIGADGNESYSMNGLIDEVRIYNDMRTTDEIKFEYRNVSEADNELIWGGEEDAPTPALRIKGGVIFK